MSEESTAKADASDDKVKPSDTGDAKPAEKSEAASEEKPAAKADEKGEAKAEAKKEANAEAKKEAKADAKPEPRKEPRSDYKELSQNIKTAGYGSVALGAVLIGVSLGAVVRSVLATSVSPLAPGVFALLLAIVLFRTATEVESLAAEPDAERREKKLVEVFTSLAVDTTRYLALTLALGSIAFLLVNFR